MLYIGKILKGIPDTRKLQEYEPNTPARILIEKYQHRCEHDATLPVISDQSTGLQFKQAMAELDPAEKVTLLFEYLVATSAASPLAHLVVNSEERVQARENLKLKHWLIKATVWFLGPVVFLVVGAAIAIAVRTGVAADNPAFNSIISTAMEILKLIFSSTL